MFILSESLGVMEKLFGVQLCEGGKLVVNVSDRVGSEPKHCYNIKQTG